MIYQAIYDAVRSRIHGGDIGGVVERVIRECFDISWTMESIKQEFVSAGFAFQAAGEQHQRPSAVFRPTLSADGDQWMMLLGENLQEGIAGFGDTPELAAQAFDKAWKEERTPAAMIAARAQTQGRS